MARPELRRLYVAALKIAGWGSSEVDGEEAFLAGASKLAETLR